MSFVQGRPQNSLHLIDFKPETMKITQNFKLLPTEQTRQGIFGINTNEAYIHIGIW